MRWGSDGPALPRLGWRTWSRATRPIDGVRDRGKGASPQKGCVATITA